MDPQKKISAVDRLRALRLTTGSPEEQKEAHDRAELRIGALGSGSDYTVFLDHLGIASLDVGYGGEDHGGSYHSIYDSFDHYARFMDPGFVYGVALVQTAGRIVLRLAQAETLPFEFSASADAIGGYAREVAKLADDLREETDKRNRLIREGRYEAAADPRETFLAPKAKAAVPHLNFAPLQNAVSRLKQSAQQHEQARRGVELSGKAAAEVDVVLFRSERALTGEGLPRRPWFKHLIYAPGFYTGYGVKTLPGIREGIEQAQWDEARSFVPIVAGAITKLSGEVDRATAMLKKIRP